MKKYYFTFGDGQEHYPGHVLIEASSASEARNAMFEKYGGRWSMMYNDYSKIHPNDRERKDRIVVIKV